MSRLVPVVLLSVVAAAATAAAQPSPAAPAGPRVGIVVELTVNVSPDRAEQLGAALADALHRELEVDAVGGADVTRRLPEGGVPDECLARRDCVTDLARRLDATELLFLAVVQVGADIQLDASWADVATGEIVARPRIELLADARAGEVFSAAATRLLPHARRRPLAVVVQPGASRPAARDRYLTRGAWLAGGAGVAALAGGAILGLSARSTYQRCLRDERDPDTRDGIGRRALAADLLLGGAVVGVGVAVVLYLRSDARPPATEAPPRAARARWSVTPSPGGAFAEVHVGF